MIDVATNIGSLNEDYFQSTDNLIEVTLNEEINAVMTNDSILPSNKNKAIIERLYDKGIFRLKNSVTIVEDLMSISKNTTQIAISSRPLFKLKKPSVSSLLEFD